MTIDAVQQRVLGALMEKETATPESYPLSLNALVNACNQRSSRDPVMDLDEEQARQALHGLEEHGLTTPVRDSRVPKYEHRARTVLNLRRDETALLCLLLLRGPQTPGELRSRADRLFPFEDLSAVQSALERLANRGMAPEEAQSKPGVFAGPLVVLLARQPGSREPRYAHLLGGAPAAVEIVTARGAATLSTADRLAELETEVALMRLRVEALEERLAGAASSRL